MFWNSSKRNNFESDRVYSQFYQFGNFPTAGPESWARINYDQPLYLIALYIRTPSAGMRFDFSWMQGGISVSGEIKWPITGYQFSPTAPGISANVNWNGATDPAQFVNACTLNGGFYKWPMPIRMDWMKFGPTSGNFVQFQIWYTLKHEQ